MSDKKDWKGTTFGNGWMHKWLIRLLRVIDLRLLYGFESVFVIPVCLLLNTNHSRTTAYRYFRERIGFSPLKAAWKTYTNHCLFGQVVVDKFAMYAGRHFNVEKVGMDLIYRLNDRPEGYVQLSSHIGNYEIAGYTLMADKKGFNALVFAGEKESVMDNRNKMFSDTLIHMIPLRPDMSHLFAIDNALQNGEIVSMPADRINGSPKFVERNFLGGKARFPQGPFSVATMRGLDVVAVNVMKTGLTRYKIFITPLSYDKSAKRKEQVEQLSQAYVAELERVIRMYPAQWYNYYEFWVEE